jgi:hypothetical protein
MKAKRVICVVKGHEWIVGRVAESWARELVKDKKSYHNRACSRCEKEEWNADDVEKEAERLMVLRDRLGYTKKQADLEPGDQPVDPDEFP